MGETRKLAAILCSDVVGYSRLAGADEDRILARLRALRSDLIDPTIAVHHGRIVKFASPRRAANIAHLRELLANADDASQPFGDAGMGVADAASADVADAFAIAQICPCCGGRMSVVETFARGAQPRSFKADAARIDTS